MEKISGFLLRPTTVTKDDLEDLMRAYGGPVSFHYGAFIAIRILFAIFQECGLIKMKSDASKMLLEKVELMKEHYDNHGQGDVNPKFFEGFWTNMVSVLSRVFKLKQKKTEKILRKLFPFQPH